MHMDIKDLAVEYLSKDILKNCDIINYLKIYPDDIYFNYVGNDGVCFNFISKPITCVSTNNRGVAEKIVKNLTNVNNCICKNRHDFEVFNEKFHFVNCDELYQFVHNIDKNFKPYDDIKTLSKASFDEMYTNFSVKNINRELLSNLFDESNFYGCFLDNRIVGIVGRHFGREIGFLEVLPDYRNNGIAFRLMETIINEKSDNVSFFQVLINNQASLRIHEKLGATKCPTSVFWCYCEHF